MDMESLNLLINNATKDIIKMIKSMVQEDLNGVMEGSSLETGRKESRMESGLK